VEEQCRPDKQLRIFLCSPAVNSQICILLIVLDDNFSYFKVIK
jgi:hypothetical protein